MHVSDRATGFLSDTHPRVSITEFSRSSLPCQGKSEVEENGAVEIARCSRGQYFGELALVTNKPRAASAHAIGTVKCLGRSHSGGRASPACSCDTCIPWAHVTVPMSSLGPQVLWSPQERTRSRFIALWNPICGSPSFFLYKSSHTILFFRTGMKEHLVLVKNWEYGVLGLIFPIKFVFLKKKSQLEQYSYSVHQGLQAKLEGLWEHLLILVLGNEGLGLSKAVWFSLLSSHNDATSQMSPSAGRPLSASEI